MGRSHYDNDDKENALTNLKDHKPKSAKGYFQYSEGYLRLQNPHEPTDRHSAATTSGLGNPQRKWNIHFLKIRVYTKLWRKQAK